MANNVDPDQTAPIGAVCSGSTMFASILNWSVMLGIYLQQTTSPHDIFRCIFFLGALRVNSLPARSFCNLFLSSADFFFKFFQNSLRNTIRVSNSLDPDPKLQA